MYYKSPSPAIAAPLDVPNPVDRPDLAGSGPIPSG